MSDTFAYFVKEAVEKRVRKLIKEGHNDKRILKETCCFPDLIDKIRNEEKVIEKSKAWKKRKIGEITELERWLE